MNFVAQQMLKIIKKDTKVLAPFKSPYALENLYPKSNLNLTTPSFVPEDPSSKFSGYIPLKEIDITYSGSGAPGGQNVNRVKTKVDLRFNVKTASWLHDELKDKLLEKHRNQMNKDGYLIIKSELTRSQQLNLADALQKLRQMIRDLIVVPAEPDELTIEKHRKKQLKAAQERVFVKRARSQLKKDRQGPNVHDG